MTAPVSEGETFTYARTFTAEEVEAFADISRDRGHHHTEPDGDGRLMVHGLLTATLMTKIGGDLNYVAREMEFEFIRPVYTGEKIICTVTAENVVDGDDRIELATSSVCTNSEDEMVLRATSDGVIFQ